VTAISGNETTYVEWNVNVASAGTYLISLRYAHDTSPRPLSVGVMIIAFMLFTHRPWN
jgi:hypothetical protein